MPPIEGQRSLDLRKVVLWGWGCRCHAGNWLAARGGARRGSRHAQGPLLRGGGDVMASRAPPRRVPMT